MEEVLQIVQIPKQLVGSYPSVMCHTGLSVTTLFCKVLSLSTEKYADFYQQASSMADLSAYFQFGMVDRIVRLQGLTSTWPSWVLF